jgi:hypothetical protein
MRNYCKKNPSEFILEKLDQWFRKLEDPYIKEIKNVQIVLWSSACFCFRMAQLHQLSNHRCQTNKRWWELFLLQKTVLEEIINKFSLWLCLWTC